MVRVFLLLFIICYSNKLISIFFINRASNHTGPANDTVRIFGTWIYQTCLPVRHISHSSQFGRTERSFFDITAGIHNPNVFIPRQECLTQEEYAIRDVLFGKPSK
jgi:hypothetical protein